MKLPRGQNLVTMQRAPNSNQTMQIKLPPTTERQHWCTIRVQDDSLARKVSVHNVHRLHCRLYRVTLVFEYLVGLT